MRRVSTIFFYDKEVRILFQDRRDISKFGEEWGFFGGSIEGEETPRQAVIREIREELGIRISIDKHFETHNHTYTKDGEEHQIRLMAYLCNYGGGEVRNIDCQDSRWVEYDKLRDYDWAEADIPILEKLIRYSELKEP